MMARQATPLSPRPLTDAMATSSRARREKLRAETPHASWHRQEGRNDEVEVEQTAGTKNRSQHRNSDQHTSAHRHHGGGAWSPNGTVRRVAHHPLARSQGDNIPLV